MDKRLRAVSLLILLFLCILFFKIITGNQFTSVGDFQTYIQSFGAAGPLILTIIHMRIHSFTRGNIFTIHSHGILPYFANYQTIFFMSTNSLSNTFNKLI